MAVTFDAVGPSSSGAGENTSISLTWTHTVGASATALIVCAVVDGVTTLPSPATFNGVAMSILASETVGSNSIAIIYGVLNPPTGSHTVSLTDNTATDITAGSMSFNGVGSFGNTFVNQSTSQNSPATVVASTTTSGGMLAACFGVGNTITALTTGTQAFLNNLENSGGGFTGNIVGGYIASTGGSITFDCTYSASGVSFAAVCVELLAASGPAFSTFQDNFPGSSLDANWNDVAGTPTISGNVCTLPCTSGYSIISSAGLYNLTGSYAFAKVGVPAVGNGSKVTEFMVGTSESTSTAEVALMYSDGTTLYCQSLVSGTMTGVASITYNSTTMAWWRIRELSGTIYFDYASDGITWTNLGSTVYGANYSVFNLSLWLYSGYNSTESASNATFAWVNEFPPVVTTGSAETITPTSATLQATVNPGYLVTTYVFNWGTTNSYGNTSITQHLPAGGSTDVANLTQLNGLSPSTTYHFQISATNALGTTTGSDAQFTTAAQGADWNPYLGDPSWFFGGHHNFDYFFKRSFEGSSSGTYTAAATDSLALTDTCRVNAQPAHTTDSLVLSDSARVSAQNPRSTDSLVLSDTTRISAQTVRSTDSLVLSDSARTHATLGKSTDSLVLSDTTRTSVTLGKATDALVLTDTAVGHLVVHGNVTDALVLTDSARTSVTLGKTTDSLVITDSARISASTNRATDSLVLSDSARTYVTLGKAADSLVLSDVATTIGPSGHTGNCTDSLVLTDSARTAITLGRATDSLVISDTARTHVTLGKSTDSLVLSDVARPQASTNHATDSLVLSDSARTQVTVGKASDALVLSDSARTAVTLGKVSDSLVLSDSTRTHITLGKATDSLVISDSVRTSVTLGKSTDSLILSDVVTAVGPGGHTGNGTDSLVLSDSTRTAVTVGKSTDSLVLSDSARTHVTLGKSTDSLVLSDVTRIQAITSHTTDSLVLSDIARTSAQHPRSTDSLILSDVSRPNGQTARTTDTVSLTDSARVKVTLAHGTDSIAFSDYCRPSAQVVRATDSVVLSDVAQGSATRNAACTDRLVLSDVATAYISSHVITVGHESMAYGLQPAMAFQQMSPAYGLQPAMTEQQESLGLVVQPALE